MQKAIEQSLPSVTMQDGRGLTGVYRAIVLNALSEMKAGSLCMTLPDGEVNTFGARQSSAAAQIRVINQAFFRKCVLYGDIGFGESYVDGDWETDNIACVVEWFLLNIETSPTLTGTKRKFHPSNIFKMLNRFYYLSRANTPRLSRRNIADHYDLSNEFFAEFLDAGMTYSCAYFKTPEQELEDAQSEKYDRLCRILNIQPGENVLEIGSGWGGFAVHAAKKYNCHVTTATISGRQFDYAKERIQREGLSERVDVCLTDYRNLTGSYDKIVSIEMLEAVGHEYLPLFFKKCHELLKSGGVLGLQVITCPDSRYDMLRKNVDWIQKHVFPGSLLPSIAAINQAVNKTGTMFLHDVKDFGNHYARTLSLWRENFNRNLEKVRTMGFDETFIRKWNYYLSYCEAAFATRNISVVQMVYTRPNNRVLDQ